MPLKVHMSCKKCVSQYLMTELFAARKRGDGGEPDETPARTDVWVESVEPNENGVYEGVCPRGHRVAMVLKDMKHELLLDAAALALVDGYYREAVATFAASLERALEFFVRVVWRHLRVPDEQVEQVWKFAGAQSERQFGMFLGAYAVLQANAPPFTASEYSKQIELRNSVVHKGAFIGEDRARAFGSFVYRVIQGLHLALYERADEAGRLEVDRTIRRALAHADVDQAELSYPRAMMLSYVEIHDPDVDWTLSFDERLELLAADEAARGWPERLTVRELSERANMQPRELLAKLDGLIGSAQRPLPPRKDG